MKKFFGRFLAVGVALALSVGTLPATFAAEDSGITVQLDGQALTFTDAVPQVRDWRTFLPFRAVFEAMGAQVSYEGSVITATRGDKTLTMTLNETAATVTQDGKTTAITMDVAPYVDSATWRTYVPVRFAAQAFDCVVGWDQANSTAIIVDTDKLLDTALAGKSFTYLEKLMAYSEKYNQGVWDMEADFDADMTALNMPMTISGAMTGTVQDAEKMSVDMNMKMDLTELVKAVATLLGQGETLSAEDQAALDSMKNEGVDLAMRGDLGAGKLYMNMSGVLFDTAGMDADTWYEMDMASLMEQSGMDWSELLELSKNIDYAALVKTALSAAEPTDSATAYESVKATVEGVVASLSDDGFVRDGDQYTAAVALEEDGVFASLIFVLEMPKDTVTGYVMSMAVESQEDDITVSMDMTIAVDDKDQMQAEMNMDMAGLMTMKMTMEGKYAPGKTAPQTQPPAGAKVVNFMELTGAQEDASLGVIGGADGPTSIVVGQ